MSRLSGLFRRRQLYTDLSREIQQHLDEKTEELVAAGMARPEAAAAARRAFGSISLTEENSRDVWRWPIVEDSLGDIRYALRGLRRNPAFTAVAVFTLALGIGANTAIFSVVYAVLLKPLPFANAGELLNVFEVQPSEGITGTGWSFLNFAEVREQNHVFTEMAGSQQHQLTLTGRGDPSVVNTSVVTPELFSLFGGAPLLGRVFRADDGKAGAPPVVILSEGLWRSVFGSETGIVGNSITLDKRSFTVVGIMAASFRFPQLTKSEQLWIPLVQDPLFGSFMPQRAGHWLQVTGRLKPGVSMTQARAELDAIGARLASEFPAENRGWAIRTVPLQQMIVGNVRLALLVLLGAVGLVLFIACANIANLLLTRATARTREIATRMALGAGRTRVIRQLLSETAVLGLLGGVAGIALAYWGVRVLGALLPPSVPRVNAIRVDHVVLGFALLLSAVATVVSGLIPALMAAHSDLESNLREGGGRSSESRRTRRARNILATGEIALAMVLLVGASLFLRSFVRLTSVSPGFDVPQLVDADISLPRYQYSLPQQWTAFSDELLARLQARPGLEESAVVVPRPIADGIVNLGFEIVGEPAASAGTSRTANYVAASPDYFHVMGISLGSGRLFDQHDIASAPRVTVISAALAHTYFPNQDPIGKQLAFGFPPERGVVREIVGIVGNVRDVELGKEPRPMMYVPYAQSPFWGANLVVRTSLSLSSVASTIRREVAEIDKDLPVTDVGRMSDIIDASVAQPRFRTFLLGLFAAMAVVLAAIGILGVISYSVSCRTNEFGIRVATGATAGSILRMVLRECLILTVAGLALGVPAALMASRLVRQMFFDVSAYDSTTIVAVGAILAAVTTLAGYIPARRAMRVDPLSALRCG